MGFGKPAARNNENAGCALSSERLKARSARCATGRGNVSTGMYALEEPMYLPDSALPLFCCSVARRHLCIYLDSEQRESESKYKQATP